MPKDQCYNCGKVTSPPHRAANCPEARSTAAVAAGTWPEEALPAASTSPTASAGGQKQEKLAALAKAYLAELASGSSTDDLLRRLACPTVMVSTTRQLGNAGGIVMIADTGAEVHVIGRKDQKYLMNVRNRRPPCVLETANGQVVLSMEGEVECDGITMWNCVFNPYVDFSLMSVACMENDGWAYTQGGGSCRIARTEARRRT